MATYTTTPLESVREKGVADVTEVLIGRARGSVLFAQHATPVTSAYPAIPIGSRLLTLQDGKYKAITP